jgi:hypothetical protein
MTAFTLGQPAQAITYRAKTGRVEPLRRRSVLCCDRSFVILHMHKIYEAARLNDSTAHLGKNVLTLL